MKEQLQQLQKSRKNEVKPVARDSGNTCKVEQKGSTRRVVARRDEIPNDSMESCFRRHRNDKYHWHKQHHSSFFRSGDRYILPRPR